ncbi:MAG: hypothetical protein SFU99_08095 [Saprospiraceae bacterium]|nr:hypothetical protein [Saprospiraceae bacterium]
MKKAIIGLLLLCFAVGASYAQDEDLPEPQGELARRVEAMKKAFITDRIGLTPKESQDFWPIYNQYEEEQKKIRQKYKFSGNFATMTDADAEKMVEGNLEMEQELLNLKRDYIQRMRKVIPIRKVAMLGRAEREFREELVKRLKDLQMNRPRRRN